jgi:hypothetical protein
MNRDPQRRGSWEKLKSGFTAAVLSVSRKSSKQNPDGSPVSSPPAINPDQLASALGETSPSQRSTPIVPLAEAADLTSHSSDGIGFVEKSRTRYRIEPLLTFGGEQGKMELLGSEVVYPAVPGLDLNVVALNGTPVRSRTLPGTANVTHAASSPACLVLHLGVGVFKIYTPGSEEIAELKLDGRGKVMAMDVSVTGGTIGIIVAEGIEGEDSYLALSSRRTNGTYAPFQRSPMLPISSTKIVISRSGMAVCISDQVATLWSVAAGDALFDFVWSSDFTCMAFFENPDPSFASAVGDRNGRILFGCSDLLEVKSDPEGYTLASTHLTGKVSSLVVLRHAVVVALGDNITVYDLSFACCARPARPARACSPTEAEST